MFRIGQVAFLPALPESVQAATERKVAASSIELLVTPGAGGRHRCGLAPVDAHGGDLTPMVAQVHNVIKG